MKRFQALVQYIFSKIYIFILTQDRYTKKLTDGLYTDHKISICMIFDKTPVKAYLKDDCIELISQPCGVEV